MYAGRIPDEIIAAVLRQNDIVDVVGKYVHLTKKGRNFVGLCPFHSEKTPSFNVSPEKQIYHCFGCGAGGHVIRFVMNIEGLTFPEAVRSLAEEAGIVWRWGDAALEETPEQRERKAMIAGHELAVKIYHYVLKNTAEGQKAVRYLRGRGFSDKLIDEFEIGYAPRTWDMLARYLAKNGHDPETMEKAGLLARREDGSYTDRFRDRIMFPIHDAAGRPIAFSGRIIDDDGGPKYLNSPETPLFQKSRTLFNLHRAKSAIRKTETAVLFEGFADVIKAWQAGVRNGVAAMGTALTERHARTIRGMAKRVIVCYDGDGAGQSAAQKAIPLLEADGGEVRVALLPEGTDPDEYIAAHGAEAFLSQVIDGAVSVADFRLLMLRRQIPPVGDEGKLRYVQAALRIVAALPTPVERELYVKRLAAECGFSVEALNEQLAGMRRQAQKNGRARDNNQIRWNNVMQGAGGAKSARALLPAYHNAERKLLAAMMEDRELAMHVQEQLGDAFNVEAHAAIAAYLYAFYAKEKEPNPGLFIASLEDERLAALAGQLAFSEDSGIAGDPQVVEDYIREIRKFPKTQAIKQKREEQQQAERIGDVRRAAQIGMEIKSLELELKSL